MKFRNFIFYTVAPIVDSRNEHSSKPQMMFYIGGPSVCFTIDSGAPITIIKGQTYQEFLGKGCKAWMCAPPMDDYHGYEEDLLALSFETTFMTDIKFINRSIQERIYVTPKGHDNIRVYEN